MFIMSHSVLYIVLVASCLAFNAAAGASLPLQWRWLEQKLPEPVVRAAAASFFEGLPQELCRMGPSNLTSLPLKFMDQLCPLKFIQDPTCVPCALHRRNSSDSMSFLAARPRTLGGAAMLLSSPGGAAAAARLQRRFCGILQDPWAACGWKLPAGGNSTEIQNSNPYKEHLEAGYAARLVPEWPSELQPPKFKGWFSFRDPLEGPSEGVVQSAMWWFGNAVPLMRSKVLQEGYIPPQLHEYVADHLERLPEQLCGAPAGDVAALPNKFQDEVCPIANLFKPAFGGVGTSSWGFMAAKISMGVNISGDVIVSAPPQQQEQLPAAAAGFPEAPEPDYWGQPLDANATAAAAAAPADSPLAIKLPYDPDGAIAAFQAASAARDAANRRAGAWMGRMCFAVYAPELACNATVARGLKNRTSDMWEAYTALKQVADAEETDLLWTRANARRFWTASAAARALGSMPPAARRALAAPLGRGVEGLAAAIEAAPLAAAVALYGPLAPWVCVMSLEEAKEQARGDLIGVFKLLGDVIIRAALRLDEPSAVLAAALGDSRSRPALSRACVALRRAWAAVANSTVPQREAAAGAAKAAAGALNGVAGKLRAVVARPRAVLIDNGVLDGSSRGADTMFAPAKQ